MKFQKGPSTVFSAGADPPEKCYDKVRFRLFLVQPQLIYCSYSANTLSQRSQLFPEDRLNGSRSSTPSQRAANGYNSSSNRFDSQVMDSLESQNDDIIEGLSQKVRILKNVTISFV